MDFDEYQELSMRTADRSLSDKDAMLLAAIGLGGETGEVMEIIKKKCFHFKDYEEADIIKEAGDILWYLALLMDTIGRTLSDAAVANVAKLAKRYPNGFTHRNAKLRLDEDEKV